MGPREVASVREWYLRGEGCRLYVREFGVGDTVVILHGGWGAEHSYLLTPFRGLEDEYHLVFYDQRGSLRSPCPDSAVSVQEHVSDLDRLRRQLGLEQLVLFGHSMGGWLAMKYLERHPNHVAGLVLSNSPLPRLTDVDAGLYGEEQRNFIKWQEGRQSVVRTVVEEEGLDRPADELNDRELSNVWRINFAAGNIVRVDLWRQMEGGRAFYDQSAGRAAGRSMRADDGWDFLDDLAAFEGTSTFILGDHDLVGFGAALHQQQLEPLERATLEVLSDSGHNSWIDRPVAYREMLTTALRRAFEGSSGRR